MDSIQSRLAENDFIYTQDEFESLYQETSKDLSNDYDYEVKFEAWQIFSQTPDGYYVNVDFGMEDQKQVFIQGKYVDKHLDGTYSLFIKRTDYFPISGQASPTKNRFVSGATLIKRLSLYNE
ncbi:hypothetical protein ACM2W4_16365 (plasmid) [Enterococcus casseliflavus]|uniref:hypothetical protein n=1 Tax=Enterococcus casseliflavus TaxID=37734 RepID=UPI002DB62C9E|nr:hypothetical protein [Enterococcus casseliflavus]